MKRLIEKRGRRKRRKMSIRRKIAGSSQRPRLSVFKSNKHIYVQVIDDSAGNTLVAASSRGGDTKGLKPTVADGAKLGEAVGALMKEKEITEAVFDRNGHLYHGVVRAVADGARKAGIRL
jgi:large subunit ribosomal protein L18